MKRGGDYDSIGINISWMFKIDKSDCKVTDCKIIGLIKMDYLFLSLIEKIMEQLCKINDNFLYPF